MPAPRPKRPRKFDAFTSSDATREETMTHFAIGPFDEACRRMDAKWGTDRLPSIVGPTMAAIWGQTMANLNAAIERSYNAANPDQARADLIACVESALRGFAAMDAEAERTGQDKADPEIWEAEVNGFRFAIIRDDRMWHGLKVERPDLHIVTMSEAANAIRLHHTGEAALEKLRDHFPDAKIVQTRSTMPRGFYAAGGDDIPGE